MLPRLIVYYPRRNVGYLFFKYKLPDVTRPDRTRQGVGRPGFPVPYPAEIAQRKEMRIVLNCPDHKQPSLIPRPDLTYT